MKKATGSFSWSAVKGVMSKACAAGADERRVLLVLSDASYHVREVLNGPAQSDSGLLGFVVYRDDPELSQRTEDTTLLFVRPEEVRRVLIVGYDCNANQALGF